MSDLSPEVIKHRAEFPKEAQDRWMSQKETPEDLIALAMWEAVEALQNLPPDADKNGLDGGDAWHAGCCVLRVYVYLMKLQDKATTPPHPAVSGEDGGKL